MQKIMRNAPSLIVFVVMLLQTPRVADFGDRIGVWMPFAVIFALFLTISNFTLSFFQGQTDGYLITADKKDKKAFTAQVKMARLYKNVHSTATIWLFWFVLIEGSLNLAETMTNLKETVKMFDWEWFGAIVYGIFPTLAAYGMGKIQALISKLPHNAGGASEIEKVFDAFMRWVRNAFDASADAYAINANASDASKTQNATKGKRNADAYPKACPHCGEMQANSNAYSGHVGRWCKKKPTQIGFVAQPVNHAATTTSGVGAETVKKQSEKE